MALDLEAIKARCKKHELFYTYSGEDGRLEVWSNEAAEDMTALIEEIDRLQTWDGLLEWLDRVYPPDVFTGESGDPGPRLVVLTRRVAELEAEKEMAE